MVVTANKWKATIKIGDLHARYQSGELPILYVLANSPALIARSTWIAGWFRDGFVRILEHTRGKSDDIRNQRLIH
jgi:hypothetical protein